jgi:hypothetical protein
LKGKLLEAEMSCAKIFKFIVIVIVTLALMGLVANLFPKSGEWIVIGFLVMIIWQILKLFFGHPSNEGDHEFHYTDDSWFTNFRARSHYEENLAARRQSEHADEVLFGKKW